MKMWKSCFQIIQRILRPGGKILRHSSKSISAISWVKCTRKRDPIFKRSINFKHHPILVVGQTKNNWSTARCVPIEQNAMVWSKMTLKILKSWIGYMARTFATRIINIFPYHWQKMLRKSQFDRKPVTNLCVGFWLTPFMYCSEPTQWDWGVNLKTWKVWIRHIQRTFLPKWKFTCELWNYSFRDPFLRKNG